LSDTVFCTSGLLLLLLLLLLLRLRVDSLMR